MEDYVHGYSKNESARLDDQADVLKYLLHRDTTYEPDSLILEAGCGIGAQTRILAEKNRLARFISVDISDASLAAARTMCRELNLDNVQFEKHDIYHLEFDENRFDHVFCCFVLEHLARPDEALRCLDRVLKPGGTITVIEGDHGSFFCHPESEAAREVVGCLVRLQQCKGGDSKIGRKLYPLLHKAGFSRINVEPRTIYADGSRPEIVSGFSHKTFIAMVSAVGREAIHTGLISKKRWEEGLRDLECAAEHLGTFTYTFFKAVAVKIQGKNRTTSQ